METDRDEGCAVIEGQGTPNDALATSADEYVDVEVDDMNLPEDLEVVLVENNDSGIDEDPPTAAEEDNGQAGLGGVDHESDPSGARGGPRPRAGCLFGMCGAGGASFSASSNPLDPRADEHEGDGVERGEGAGGHTPGN